MALDKHNQRPKANPSGDNSAGSANGCRRCGICCEKGGPGFHREDRRLIETGRILSKYLYTIRNGELAFDNVKLCLAPAKSDIIKIKGQEGSWTCIFFEPNKKACTIYNDRPLECRVLKCWDPADLKQVYGHDRLSREDLLSQVKGLWELIDDHQRRCDYKKITKLINELDSPGGDKARKELMEIIQYDAEIRKLVLEKGRLDPAILDFAFGRPLTVTLPGYGIKVRQEGRKTIISRTG
jgi:Fe-S-cluster containining protein